MVNGFVRVPPGAWKMLQAPANTIEFTIPTMPIDVLQEIDILKQFVSRLGVVGWNSKQQFEETWMTLLSVLVPSSESDIPKEELISRIQVNLLFKFLSIL
jgi:huntingtin